MPAATKTKFAVTSRTGYVHTRSSHRAYTHAVIHVDTAASQKAAKQRELAYEQEMLAEYLEIARHLADGTSPASGSVLLKRATSMSYNMERAGVRTRWDAVRYDVRQGSSWANADTYLKYAENQRRRIAAIEERLERPFSDSECATWHHNAVLAWKACAGTRFSYAYIVPVN